MSLQVNRKLPTSTGASLRRRAAYSMQREGEVHLATVDPQFVQTPWNMNQCTLSLKKKQRWRVLEHPEMCADLFQHYHVDKKKSPNSGTYLVQRTMHIADGYRAGRNCLSNVLLGHEDDGHADDLTVLSTHKKRTYKMNAKSLLATSRAEVEESNGGVLHLALIHERNYDARTPESHQLPKTQQFSRKSKRKAKYPVHQVDEEEESRDSDEVLETNEEEEDVSAKCTFRRAPRVQLTSTDDGAGKKVSKSTESKHKSSMPIFPDNEEEDEELTSWEMLSAGTEDTPRVQGVPVRLSMSESSNELRRGLQDCYGEENVLVTADDEEEVATLVTVDLTRVLLTLSAEGDGDVPEIEVETANISRYAAGLVLKRTSLDKSLKQHEFVASLNILWRSGQESNAEDVLSSWRSSMEAAGRLYSSVQDLVEETVWRLLPLAQGIDIEAARVTIPVHAAHPCPVQDMYSSWVVARPLQTSSLSIIDLPEVASCSPRPTETAEKKCAECNTSDQVLYGPSSSLQLCDFCCRRQYETLTPQTPLTAAFLMAWMPLECVWRQVLRPRWSLLNVHTCPYCSRHVQLASSTGTTMDVDCACGESFCSQCGSMAHWPMSCQLAECYTDLFQLYNDLPGTTGRLHGAASGKSQLWKFIGQPCPKCHTVVKKSVCCNAICQHCRFMFCWSCDQEHRGAGCPPHAKPRRDHVYYFSSRVKDPKAVKHRPVLYSMAVKLHRMKMAFAFPHSRRRLRARGCLSKILQEHDPELRSLQLATDTVDEIRCRQEQWNVFSDILLNKFVKMCHVTESLCAMTYILEATRSGEYPLTVQSNVSTSLEAAEKHVEAFKAASQQLCHILSQIQSIWEHNEPPVAASGSSDCSAGEEEEERISEVSLVSPVVVPRKDITTEWVDTLLNKASKIVEHLVLSKCLSRPTA